MRHLEYTNLFRDLATAHVGIQHRADQMRFARLIVSSDPIQKVLDAEEFYAGLKNKIDLKGGQAVLVLENYQADYTDNDGDYYGKQHHGAIIVLKLVKAGDYDGRDVAIDACEAIGEEVMAGAIQKLRALERSVKVSPGDILQEAIGPLADNLYGARFNFSFRTPATGELTYNPAKFLS